MSQTKGPVFGIHAVRAAAAVLIMNAFDSFIHLFLVFKRKFCYQMDISQLGRYTISPQSLLLLLWNISVKETNSYTNFFESDGISMDRQNGRQVSFLQVVHSYG